MSLLPASHLHGEKDVVFIAETELWHLITFSLVACFYSGICFERTMHNIEVLSFNQYD